MRRGADKGPGPVAADEPRSPNGQQVNASLKQERKGTMNDQAPSDASSLSFSHLVCREMQRAI